MATTGHGWESIMTINSTISELIIMGTGLGVVNSWKLRRRKIEMKQNVTYIAVDSTNTNTVLKKIKYGKTVKLPGFCRLLGQYPVD